MPGTVINEIVFKTLITYSHIVVLCVFRNGRLMWEVNDKMSYEKFKVSQTILPKRGTIRKTQTYQHVLWCCPEGTPEGTTRNPVRLGARGPKFQQTSIENRSKTSISSSSICSVQHFHPISKIQIETCPPFLPQTCHAIMPHLSPHPFRWSYTEDAAGAGAAAGWAAPWLCSPRCSLRLESTIQEGTQPGGEPQCLRW